LDTRSAWPPRQEIERAMQGHLLGQAKLMGQYERR
jgi:phosphatidylethanolamine-binding protein (PEBP) family uncharacterized protein